MTEPRTASLGDRLLSRLIIFVTLATVGVAALWMLEVVPAQRFRDTAIEIAGVVTATSCDNRGTVVYAYSIGGRTYSGTDQPTGECDLVSVGDHVSVWYSPENPEQSDLAPLGNLDDAIELAIVTPVFFSAAAISIFAWNNRRKREPPRGEMPS